MKLILPPYMALTPSSVFLPFPPLGNDLEALQIHLCFCRSNLHPQRTARSGSTLVSAVSNIYLSQQTRDKPGSCWRLQTGGQSYQLAARSLPADNCFVRGFETDWICLPFASYCSCKRNNEGTSSNSGIYSIFFFC